MELMNQPFTGQLGNRLIELLASSDYHTFNIAVAFAKNSGVLRIKNSLETFRERGGKINIFVGVDLGGTSYEALLALLRHSDSLNVVHLERGQTFHVKIYQFLGKEKGLINIGSHNLTGGGLWTNLESSMFLDVDGSSEKETKIFNTFEEYIDELKALKASFMSISSQDDIEKLLENGYVAKEVSGQLRRTKSRTKGADGERLFGNSVPAKLPSVAKPKKDSVTPAPVVSATPDFPSLTDEGDTIWFETRKMTGGSRNILDLSMKSLVEAGDPTGTPFDIGERKFMRGGVEFFDLDAKATNQKKDITLHFDGIDYSDNTILFPTGNNANGTWRLQIKGTSTSGHRITDALTAKGQGHYLVEKIVTFTKIRSDYYFMSIFPEIDLDNFKEASRILARNGSTKNARLLGVL